MFNAQICNTIRIDHGESIPLKAAIESTKNRYNWHLCVFFFELLHPMEKIAIYNIRYDHKNTFGVAS